MNVINCDNVLDVISMQGKWWTPDDESHRIYGEFQFRSGGESFIKLYDTYYEKRAEILQSGGKVICGLCNSYEYVTAFDTACVKSNSQWNWNIEAENTVSQLLFVDAWIGPRKFESKDEVVFDRFFVGINGVSEWYEYGYEKAITTSSERERSVQMVVPKPILIYEDDEVLVEVVFRPDMAKENGFELRFTSGIMITSKVGPMRYYGEDHSFEYWKKVFFSFIGLLIGRHAVILDCIGFVTDDDSHNQEIALRHLWRRDIKKEYLKTIKTEDIRFPWRLVKDQLLACANSYVTLGDEAIYFIGHLVYLQAKDEALQQSLLPELIFMFEGLENTLYEEENQKALAPRKEQGKKMLKQLCQGQAKELISWAKQNISFYLFLDDRLKIAIEDIGEVYPYLQEHNLVNVLFKYIKDRRNKYAHGRADDYYYADFRLYMFCIFWLWTFISSMILHRCGMSLEVVKKCLWRLHAEYGETSSNLIQLLQTYSHSKNN